MSEQNLDLRTSTRIVRRRKKLFSGLVALGLLAGAAYGYVTPPPVSSNASSSEEKRISMSRRFLRWSRSISLL